MTMEITPQIKRLFRDAQYDNWKAICSARLLCNTVYGNSDPLVATMLISHLTSTGIAEKSEKEIEDILTSAKKIA